MCFTAYISRIFYKATIRTMKAPGLIQHDHTSPDPLSPGSKADSDSAHLSVTVSLATFHRGLATLHRGLGDGYAIGYLCNLRCKVPLPLSCIWLWIYQGRGCASVKGSKALNGVA